MGASGKKSFFSKVLRALKYTTVSFLCVSVTVTIAGFTISTFYGDEIKNFLLNKINKQITTEIKTEKIELSLFEKFPYVSLKFSDVVAKEAVEGRKKSELLRAKSIFLQFNIWNLFTKNYKITRVEINNAALSLHVSSEGKANWLFWKPSLDSASTSFSFDLNRLIFNDTRISYINDRASQDYKILAKDMILGGKFSDEKYNLYVSGDVFIHHFKTGNYSFLPAKDASLELALIINQKEKSYTLNDGTLHVGNLVFNTQGSVIYSDTRKYIDLKTTGRKLKLNEFIAQLPEVYRKHFTGYKAAGQFFFNATIKGNIAERRTPGVFVSFGLKNGTLTRKATSATLEQIRFDASFINGNQHKNETSLLDVKSFSANFKQGKIQGKFKLKNFREPYLDISAIADLNLEDLYAFLAIDTLEYLKGSLSLNTNFKAVLAKFPNFTAQDFINSQTTGQGQLKDVSLKVKGNPKEYKSINGSFSFSNNDIEIDQLTGYAQGSDFRLSGFFRNALSYIFLPNQRLEISASLGSKFIYLDELLESQTVSGNDTAYALRFPANLSFTLNVDVNQLTFRKFLATNITGKIRLKNGQLYAPGLEFNAEKGRIVSDILIDGTKRNNILISCDANIKGVDINKLFYEFENFGQNSLKHEHLKGVVSANVQFVSIWSTALKIDPKSVYTKASIAIENGELLDYAPMLGLSRFVKLEDLSHIRFSTLKNQIEIKDKVIHIPQMDMNSNALNIKLSGTHTFDNHINYRMQILLSELLAKKARKAKKENKEFGEIKDDGLGRTMLYILATGTVDNPVFKYDRKGVREKIATDLKKEKKNLKEILNKEFGWFKTDTLVNKEEAKKHLKEKENLKKQESGKFVFEWDEDDE